MAPQLPGDEVIDPALRDKIEKLLAASLGHHVDLPQVVIVGDQSNEKSSVLEALTKLPFSRGCGLCTRFPTQIVFRTSKHRNGRIVTPSIIPASDTEPGHARKLKLWKPSDMETLDALSFSILMDEVHDIMGFCRSGNRSVEPMSIFSKDVFRLEIWGPDEGYASIIDLPGIFKFTVPGQTAVKDIEFVREMVLGYMQNPRSVILTVIPANEDIATQDILQMAREADPDGYRTLGVLTKPDLVDERTEAGSMDLVEGKNLDFSFRWAIVRNPEQKQLPAQSTDRDDIKDNF